MSEIETYRENSPSYFEIFSKILDELSWRKVASFEAIEKDEHLRILNLINLTNSQVLNSWVWDFQIEKASIEVKKDNEKVLENFCGKIINIYDGIKKYRYIHPTLFSKTNRSEIYTTLGDKVLVKPVNFDRKLDIIYIDGHQGRNTQGDKIAKLTDKNDTSIIPVPFCEPILVYGTLIKIKANPSFAKFGFWRAMYYDSIALLRSSTVVNNPAQINLCN